METVPQHLALVGMAGVGKSAVARRLAVLLDRPCRDLDAMVVAARDGQSVAEIFAEVGEQGFRDLESAVLAECLASDEPVVVATGGGVVERPANRELLAAGAGVVWLTAPDDVLVERLRSSSVRRPLLEGDLEANLEALRSRREDWYRELADVEVTVGDHDLSRTVSDVLAAVRKRWPVVMPAQGAS
ncbi:MAG: shikimate kinase [Acidimicrobiales bacterium]